LVLQSVCGIYNKAKENEYENKDSKKETIRDEMRIRILVRSRYRSWTFDGDGDDESNGDALGLMVPASDVASCRPIDVGKMWLQCCNA
jgi:hypothetical protein